MSELIVLGLIPGTHIQITFVLWSIVVLGTVVGCLGWFGHRTHSFRNWIVACYVLLIVRRTVLQQWA